MGLACSSTFIRFCLELLQMIKIQNPEWFIEELFFRGSLLFSIKFENVTNKKMNKKRLNHLQFFSVGYSSENLGRDRTGIGELSHHGRYESTSKFELPGISSDQLTETLGIVNGVWRRQQRSNFKYSHVLKSD